MNKIDLVAIAEPLWRAVSDNFPSAVGAFLGVVFQGGTLTWTQRLLQFTVGLIVAHYVGGWLISWFDLTGMAADSVKLGFGMSAYEAARRFRAGLVEVAGKAPADIWESLKGLIGRKA